ncbi:MAG: cytosine permease [Acidimicrobiia bacterium]|nr:cytosine permease [Acidimicrobiia bacterium]
MAKRPWLATSSSDPVGLSERAFGAPEFAVLIASLAFGAPALIVGIDLLGVDPGLGLTVSQLILAAPLGIVFAAGLIAAAAWVAAENGVPTGLLMRPALGVVGSWAAALVQVAFFIAWTALELEFGGAAFVSALDALGVDGLPKALVIGGLALAATGLLVAGLAWVTQIWLYRFAFWAALVLIVVLAWSFLSDGNLVALFEVTPDANNFWLGVDGVMALGVVFFPVVADTARFVSAAPAAASGAGTGFSVAALVLVLVGGLRAVSVDVTGGDPTAFLLDGVTSFVAVVIVGWLIVSGVDQPFILSFSGATALSTISDRFAGRVQALAILAMSVVVALVVSRTTIREITELFVVVIAQMLAVLLADYFLVRRKYYETDEFYRRKGTYAGVNIYGLVAVLAGFFTAIVLRPVGPEAWVTPLESLIPSDAPIAEAVGLPPILLSMLVSLSIYTGLGRWRIHAREMVSKLRM